MVKYLDAVIRNIQRHEGHIECFNSMQGKCEELDCRWYHFCQEAHQHSGIEEAIGEKTGSACKDA